MMFCIGIDYLCGRALATHPADWERPEWPPHPDRLFMALVAAHFQGGGNADERTALEWLETQTAPSMRVSSCQLRQAVMCYVPVNDVQTPRIAQGRRASPANVQTGLALLPQSRPKQPRQYPEVIPDRCAIANRGRIRGVMPEGDPCGALLVTCAVLGRTQYAGA
jgi:CRISPR-associated protein Csb2